MIGTWHHSQMDRQVFCNTKQHRKLFSVFLCLYIFFHICNSAVHLTITISEPLLTVMCVTLSIKWIDMSKLLGLDYGAIK